MTTVAERAPFLDRIEKLPPLNAVAERVLAVTASPSSSADDIAEVLSGDPTIAAKVLRVVNSPFYGVCRQITQISRAVVMLGSVSVRNLVLGICTRDAMPVPEDRIAEHEILWQHSLAVASAADLIAKRTGYKPPEEAFLAGLLHDMGQLAMAALEPEAFRAVFADTSSGVRFLGLERKHLGIDHVDAGHRILTAWGLPQILCDVVKDHHAQEIEPDSDHAKLLAITMLADIMAHLIGAGLDVPAGTSHRAAVAVEFLGLSNADQLTILDGLERRMSEVKQMFSNADSARPVGASEGHARAVWVGATDAKTMNIGQLLLQHRGYEVVMLSLRDLSPSVKMTDLVLFDCPPEAAAGYDKLAAMLVQKGWKRVVRLRELDEAHAPRYRDEQTGVLNLPRLFTSFDLSWIEEQVRL